MYLVVFDGPGQGLEETLRAVEQMIFEFWDDFCDAIFMLCLSVLK